MKKTPKTKVYVYHDMDHGDIAVFSTLKKAKVYAEKCCDNDYDEWEDCGNGKWSRGEYQRVYPAELDGESV